jgi:hypothetical protein
MTEVLQFEWPLGFQEYSMLTSIHFQRRILLTSALRATVKEH